MIRVGLIGYGYWGPNLVRNFAELPDVEVVGIADLDTQKLALAQRRHTHIYATTHYRELLRDPTIDAILVATPVATHFPLGMETLRAGKHLWLEKPMAETPAQARKLEAEANRRKLVVHVDHTFLFTGAVQEIGERVRTGQLGDLLYYDSTRVNLGLFQRDVSVIADLAVHDFAILDYLLQQHPIAVSASGANHFAGLPESLAYITLFYQSGMIAHTNVSWLAPVKIRQILIGGSERMITYDDLQPSEKVKIYDKGVHFTEDPEAIQEMRVGYRTGDMLAPKLSGHEALQSAARHFIDRITSGVPAISGADMGARVVEVLDAATRSMRHRGHAINLPTERVAA